MPTESSTHYENLSPGYSDYKVCIQYCEHRDDTGKICDEYLGVNYPSEFCKDHEPEYLDYRL